MYTWENLVKANDDHDLALFIGAEILRVKRIAKVRIEFLRHYNSPRIVYNLWCVACLPVCRLGRKTNQEGASRDEGRTSSGVRVGALWREFQIE